MAVAKTFSANSFPADWTRADRLVAVTAFPLVMLGTLFAGFTLMQGGMAAPEAVSLCLLGAYPTIAVLERFFPHHRSWLRSQGDLRVDIGWAATNGIVNRLGEPLVLAGVVYLASLVATDSGGGLWPHAWPFVFQFGLALVVAEFVEYWAHRSMHEVDGLWRFHAVHHSAPRLYFLNAVRFHPIDLFVIGTGKLMPLAFLGAPPELLGLVTVFAAVHGAFQHSNLKLKLGPLNWVFSMAEMHRWHHSPVLAEANRNYGGNLIFWDIVFGTRWLPDDREPPEAIGMEALPKFPQGFWWQLASPFAWKRIVARSGGPAPQESHHNSSD
ncbi:MAG: sterol desaturase family protein [Deltaproteobacteria bacterium]